MSKQTDTLSGVTKAWVNFNGTSTAAIRDSFSVSSLTDHATGQYSVTISNAMSNANYSLTLGAGTGSSTRNINLMIDNESVAPTATTVRYITRDQSNGDVDCFYVLCNWTGDLA